MLSALIVRTKFENTINWYLGIRVYNILTQKSFKYLLFSLRFQDKCGKHVSSTFLSLLYVWEAGGRNKISDIGS